MSANFIDVILSDKERQENLKIEVLKRDGYKHFRVINHGRHPVETIQLNGLKSIVAVPYDAGDGTTSYRASEGAEPVFFKLDNMGRKVADIYDDQEGHNRHWVASNMVDYNGRPMLSVEDPEMVEAIKKIREEYQSNKKYEFKVELSEIDEAKRQKAKLEARIAQLEQAEKKEEPKEEKESVPRKSYKQNLTPINIQPTGE